MSAEDLDRRLGRYSRPGTPLAEHHGHGLAGQRRAQLSRRLASLDALLARSSISNEGGEFRRGEVAYGHEMAGRRRGGLRVGSFLQAVYGQAGRVK